MDIFTKNNGETVTVWPQETIARPETVVAQKKAENQLKITNARLDKNLVAELVKKSNRILASINSHKFPFDFFPDTINVEESRVTVITRNFFLSSQVHSVDIKDISNIFINMAPFFSQLVIVSKTFTANEIRVRYLRKDEAILVRRLIEGLRTFIAKQIDTSVYNTQELIAKLEELSRTEIVT